MAQDLQGKPPIRLVGYEYDMGWSDGYHDKLPDNPFIEGTHEHQEYLDGYAQGCMDC